MKELGERINKPVPLEEMPWPGDEDITEEEISEGDASQGIFNDPPKPAPRAGTPKISEKQGKFLWAMTKQAGMSEPIFRAYLSRTYGIEHSRDIPRTEMDSVLAWINRFKSLKK